MYIGFIDCDIDLFYRIYKNICYQMLSSVFGSCSTSQQFTVNFCKHQTFMTKFTHIKQLLLYGQIIFVSHFPNPISIWGGGIVLPILFFINLYRGNCSSSENWLCHWNCVSSSLESCSFDSTTFRVLLGLIFSISRNLID